MERKKKKDKETTEASFSHQSVIAPPKTAAQSETMTPRPRTLLFGESPKMRLPAPLKAGPMVAANRYGGLGVPEMVTVGTDASGLGFDPADEESATVKREETP